MSWLNQTPTDRVERKIEEEEHQLKVLAQRRTELLDTLRIIRKNIHRFGVKFDEQTAQEFEGLIQRLVTITSNDKDVTWALQTTQELSHRIVSKQQNFGKQDLAYFLSLLRRL